MGKKRIVVLGAGLSGLSVAWHLQKMGIECRVFEKEPEIGGLCRSKKINGFTFDLDGHLLHFKHNYTFSLVKDLLGDNIAGHNRSAWIYSYGRFSKYPFQANLYGLPKSVVQDCLLGFIEAQNNGHNKKSNGNSFYDWIIKTFGKGIARHFMVPYNNKFWAQPVDTLTCEWLDGFVPTPSLKEVIEGTIEESRRQFGYNARFWYPKKGGINQLPMAMASQIKNIYTGRRAVEIDLAKKTIKMSSGEKEKFDYLVSTIALPEMPGLIKAMPKITASLFKKLKWNSIFNLNLGVENNDTSGRHWVYFPHDETCFFRVGFFNNFSPSSAPLNRNSLYIEVAYSQERPIDKNNIVPRVKEDLKRIGITRPNDKVYAQDINDIKYGYPVYDANYPEAREKALEFLSRNNIVACGRYGSWRYMSMEDVILDGKHVAERVSEIV